MYVPPSFCSAVPCLSPTKVIKVKLNVDYEASYASEVSWMGFVVFFPLRVFEELLGNVLQSSLIEEVFGKFPKSSGGVFRWSRHGVSLVLMWRAAAHPPWCRLRRDQERIKIRLFCYVLP